MSDPQDLSHYERSVGSSSSTFNGGTPPAEKATGERNPNFKLIITEEEALVRCRKYPHDYEPIWITFASGDCDNPRNWSALSKWYITCLVSVLNVLTCLSCSGYSAGADQIADEFHVSSELTVLGLSMYILGFALGPMLLAPLSEHWGRNPIYVWSWLLLVIFHIPIATAKNMTTVIIARLISGVAGSAPVTNTGGTVADLFGRNGNGAAMAVYGLSSTLGPPLGVVLSGYMAQNLGWRWMIWIHMIIAGAAWILMVMTLPETRHSIILQRKARKVRHTLSNEGLKSHSNIREVNHEAKNTLSHLFKITLTRPIRFLFTEPITFSAAIYNGFIYGIVFLFNEAFPLVFGKNHHFTPGETGLSFLGLCIGSILAACLHPIQEAYYRRHVVETGGQGSPEARMWMARVGAFFLPISLFWFGWTSQPSMHWIVPILASTLFGAGIYIVILAILNYVVDSYQAYAASSLAGVILVRNVVGAGFPLFAEKMYEKLGYEWASSLLAFLAIPLIPIPWVFFYYGEKIRFRSRWARCNFMTCPISHRNSFSEHGDQCASSRDDVRRQLGLLPK